MKQKIRRSRFAQNRIDYIVYSNPSGARSLVRSYDHESPRNIHDLLLAVKSLVRMEGKKAVSDLIKLHPDTKAILRVQKQRDDSYCGACGNYSYDPTDNYCFSCGHSNYSAKTSDGSSSGRLASMNFKDLEAHYRNLLTKSGENTENSKLQNDIELAWAELRRRKLQENEKEKPEKAEDKKNWKYRDELIIASLLVIAGILIGTTLKNLKVVKKSS